VLGLVLAVHSPGSEGNPLESNLREHRREWGDRHTLAERLHGGEEFLNI